MEPAFIRERELKELAGKTAAVIGGGSGIGMGTALGLSDEGVRVVVADIEPAAAQAVAKRIEERGGRAIAVRVDGTNPNSISELVEATLDAFGGVHILTNNVGIVRDQPLAEMTPQDWEWFLEFNFLSIVRGVDAFLPSLRAHGEAHIVNTASMAALLAIPHSARVPSHIGAYTATKHAILGYTEMLRGELAPEGIGVSVLCPGMVKSNLSATAARNRPERLGGPLPAPATTSPELEAMMMPPEQVGPIVVAGIRANRLHIFTHTEARSQVEARHRRLIEDFEFFAGELS